MGGAIPEQVALGCRRKLANKQVLDEINPSLPKLLWVMLDIKVTGKRARIGGPCIPVSLKDVHTLI